MVEVEERRRSLALHASADAFQEVGPNWRHNAGGGVSGARRLLRAAGTSEKQFSARSKFRRRCDEAAVRTSYSSIYPSIMAWFKQRSEYKTHTQVYFVMFLEVVKIF